MSNILSVKPLHQIDNLALKVYHKGMNIINLINKKRLGGRLTNEEIEWVVKNYCKDKIPNYQMSALLMAICNKGFSYEETLAMTLAMKNSGNVYDFDKRESYILDKHSTGGVGDSTTFIMTSILASLGYKVVKISGRGLGHTGGTLDKLEVFKGVKHNFKLDAVRELLDKNNAVFIGAKDVAPADKKIYALRDVTGTVESVPLICASVLSKKLACGAHGIVFDVKCGEGAFARNLNEAIHLSKLMQRILKSQDVDCAFVITDMDSPLSRGIGREYEVADVLRVLHGEKCDLREVSLKLAVEAMRLQKPELEAKYAYAQACQVLDNGQAREKFAEILKSQGAKFDDVDDYMLVHKTKYTTTIKAQKAGYISKISARTLGDAVRKLGGGRLEEGDCLVPNVGIEILCNIGDKVKAGDTLAYVHYEDKARYNKVKEDVDNAFKVSLMPRKKKLVLQEIK